MAGLQNMTIAGLQSAVRRVLAAMALTTCLAVPAFARSQPPASTAQSEFEPATAPAPGDQLAAAPLVIAAYGFVWLATLFYVWTIWRRLNKVETDIHVLERRQTERR
jgi:CcmD family protein